MALTKRPATHLVRVVLWHGTTQETHEVATYSDAMRLVAARHSNAHDPAYYEIATGRKLVDDGVGLSVDDQSYYVVLA